MIPTHNPFRAPGKFEQFTARFIAENDKKPLLAWFDKFESALSKAGTNYQKSKIDPTDVLEYYYDGKSPEEAVRGLTEDTQRVVLGEAKTPSQADVDKGLKVAMKIVDDAKKRLQKLAGKLGQPDGAYDQGKWKFQKHRKSWAASEYSKGSSSSGGGLFSSKSAQDPTGWFFDIYTEENELWIAWSVIGAGNDPLKDFKSVVNNWEKEEADNIKWDAKQQSDRGN